MKSEGNCGQGARQPSADEPREAIPHATADEINPVAWHQGKTASATGYDAMKRKRATA